MHGNESAQPPPLPPSYHWRVLEHVRYNDESNAAPTNIYVLHVGDLPIAARRRHIRELNVPVVFGIVQLPTINLPSLQLNLQITSFTR